MLGEVARDRQTLERNAVSLSTSTNIFETDISKNCPSTSLCWDLSGEEQTCSTPCHQTPSKCTLQRPEGGDVVW
jgi:hypothetical protein